MGRNHFFTVQSLQRLLRKLKERSRPERNPGKAKERSCSNLWTVFYSFVNKIASDSENYFGFILFIDNSLQHGSYHLYNDVTGLEPVSVIPNSNCYDIHYNN